MTATGFTKDGGPTVCGTAMESLLLMRTTTTLVNFVRPASAVMGFVVGRTDPSTKVGGTQI